MGRVFFNVRDNVHNLAAAYTVLASDSGKVFTIDQDAAFTVTLPSDQEGLKYEFILTDAGSNDVKIDGGGSNAIKGVMVDENSVEAIDNNIVKFVSGTAVNGDRFSLVNDGTTWWCEGMCSADGGIVHAGS